MAWKSLSDKRLLWRNGIEEPYNSLSLTITTRRVIGAWESTSMELSPESVKGHLRMSLGYCEAILAAISQSNHPVVLQAMKRGLPLEASVYVSPDWGLRCKYCRSLLSSVPCNKCLIRAKRHEPDLISWEERFPLHLKEPAPTLHKPGSRGKFKVICQRASRGEKVFSDMDARADLR